jgi:WD40 repeat protein
MNNKIAALSFIRHALLLSIPAIILNPDELASQLTARLLSNKEPNCIQLLNSIDNYIRRTWLRPLTASLYISGGILQATLIGHTGCISAIDFLPNSRECISASYDSTLKIWSIYRGTPKVTLRGHTGPVNDVSVLPDGKRSISASADGTLKIWDLINGNIEQTFQHGGDVISIDVAANGKFCVSASREGKLIIWDIINGIKMISIECNGINSVAISPDGKQVLTAHSDKKLRLWDIKVGAQIATLSGHYDIVEDVVYSPDGHTAYSASDDRSIFVWDLDTYRFTTVLSGGEDTRHSDFVYKVAVSKDGKRCFSASADGKVIVWELDSNKIGYKMNTHEIRCHTAGVESIAVAPNGHTFATASDDCALKIWDFEAKTIPVLSAYKPINEDAPVRMLSVLPERNMAVVLWSDIRHGEGYGTSDLDLFPEAPWSLKLIDLNDIKVIAMFEDISNTITESLTVCDDKSLVAVAADTHLYVYDLNTLSNIGSVWCRQWVKRVGINVNGRLATVTSGEVGIVCDLQSLNVICELHGHTKIINSIVMTPKGDRVITASDDCTIRVWESSTGKQLAVLSGHESKVSHLHLSSDGCYLFSGSADGILRVWDLQNMSGLAILCGHKGAITGLTSMKNCSILMSASEDLTLRTWDINSQSAIAILHGHQSQINDIAVEPMGLFAISASNDKTIRYWDLLNQTQLAAFTCETAVVTVDIRLPDIVVAGDLSGMVHILKIEAGLKKTYD